MPRDGETFSLGDAVITARTAEGGTLALEFAYGETSGSVGMPDRSDALKPVRTDDVTVWVSDGAQLVCLTEAGESENFS